MKNNYLGELIISLVLVALAVLLINPLMIWMPTAATMMVLAVFAVAFMVFAIFIWREFAEDERENLHKLMAGRTAFLAGTGILVVGIIVQNFRGAIDPWLVAALTAMVLGKVVALAYDRAVH